MTKVNNGANLPCASCIVITTAASYQPSPGFGGYAAILLRYTEGEKKAERKLTGGANSTDNVRLEMSAVIVALKKISRGQELPIIVRVNNELIARAMNEWMPGWIAKGWKKGDGKPVKNAQLWKEIVTLCEGLTITFVHEKTDHIDLIKETVKQLASEALETQRPKAMAEIFGQAA